MTLSRSGSFLINVSKRGNQSQLRGSNPKNPIIPVIPQAAPLHIQNHPQLQAQGSYFPANVYGDEVAVHLRSRPHGSFAYRETRRNAAQPMQSVVHQIQSHLSPMQTLHTQGYDLGSATEHLAAQGFYDTPHGGQVQKRKRGGEVLPRKRKALEAPIIVPEGNFFGSHGARRHRREPVREIYARARKGVKVPRRRHL